MKILNDINRTYRSPALSAGSRVLKWAIWVSTKIRFKTAEIETLENLDLDELTSPMNYDIYTGVEGKELEIINSEIIDNLTESEISAKIDDLRSELRTKLNEIVRKLTSEYNFDLEE